MLIRSKKKVIKVIKTISNQKNSIFLLLNQRYWVQFYSYQHILCDQYNFVLYSLCLSRNIITDLFQLIRRLVIFKSGFQDISLDSFTNSSNSLRFKDGNFVVLNILFFVFAVCWDYQRVACFHTFIICDYFHDLFQEIEYFK